MAQEINDRVVVITGASSGLGEATAWRLAQEGAKLVLGARRLERLQTLAGELSLGDEAVVQTDATDYEQVRHLVDHAVQTQGRVDAIINNAGLMPLSPLELFFDLVYVYAITQLSHLLLGHPTVGEAEKV